VRNAVNSSGCTAIVNVTVNPVNDPPTASAAEEAGDEDASMKGKLKGEDATLFSGEFWTGKRGLELGLVDGMGELRAILQARYGAKVHLPVIGPRRRLLSRFGLGTSVGGTGIDGIGPATLAAIEERLHWQRFGL